jgi:predicted lipoprotein
MRCLLISFYIPFLFATSAVWAQPDIVPAPSTAYFIQAVDREWAVPLSDDFVRSSAQLQPALQALCNAANDKGEIALTHARQQWLATLSSWKRLSSVAVGPLIERRSQRQIDFTPTRPALIEKAVKSAPADLAALERVGTPAKGLPALEWMLWIKPIAPASPECRYAVLLAAEIEREARALNTAYAQAASQKLADPAAQAALNELVNQWVGGLERLSWSDMVMPARVAITAKRDTADFPHRVSGATAASWAAQWDTLRTLATGKGHSIETELRARGQNQVADALASATLKADKAMRDLTASNIVRVLDAGRELTALKQLVEDKVATALGVPIGFSDADGD